MTDVTRTAIGGLVGLLAVMATAIFTAAGTFHYWQAWLYLALFFGSSLAATFDLMKNDPALLQRRSRGGPTAEGTPTQKIIMTLASAGFIALLVVPALDRRLGWSSMPALVALAGDALIVISYLAIMAVFRANTFAASTITVEPGQHVISTGPGWYPQQWDVPDRAFEPPPKPYWPEGLAYAQDYLNFKNRKFTAQQIVVTNVGGLWGQLVRGGVYTLNVTKQGPQPGGISLPIRVLKFSPNDLTGECEMIAEVHFTTPTPPVP